MVLDRNNQILCIGDEVYYSGVFAIISDIYNNVKVQVTYTYVVGNNPTTLGKSITINPNESEKIFSWKEMSKTAIDVQDACNLSGVVHSFSKIITHVRRRLELEGNFSMENLNNNPICVLFIDKIRSLSYENFSNAYNWAQDQLK